MNAGSWCVQRWLDEVSISKVSERSSISISQGVYKVIFIVSDGREGPGEKGRQSRTSQTKTRPGLNRKFDSRSRRCTERLTAFRIANVLLQSGSSVPEWILKLPKPSKMKRKQMGKVKRPETVNGARNVAKKQALKKR